MEKAQRLGRVEMFSDTATGFQVSQAQEARSKAQMIDRDICVSAHNMQHGGIQRELIAWRMKGILYFRSTCYVEIPCALLGEDL